MDESINRTGNGPPTDEDLFESTSVWPVHLTLLTKSGLTLWGSAGTADGRDRLLTISGKLVLLPSAEALQTFVTTDEWSSMLGLPGYQMLQQQARSRPIRFDVHVAFDYRAVSLALEWPASQWDMSACVALLNALNMLDDVAGALEDQELRKRFDDPEIVALLERLTFLTADELPDVVGTLNRPLLRQLIGTALIRIESRTTIPNA